MRALNFRIHGTPPAARYVGRPHILSNPFVIGKDGTREQCVELYRAYFRRRRETDPVFAEAVEAIRGRDLVCHCWPLPCHVDVIIEELRN
jgi:hypothetical protein